MKREMKLSDAPINVTLRANKPTAKSVPKRRGKGRGSKRSDKKKRSIAYWDWPRWGVWIGAAVVAIAYIIIFYKFVTSDSFRWKAYYRDPVYPEGYEVRGIDVSHHQGVIEWEKVRNARIGDAPVTFAIIKATEGTDLVDPCFHRNISRARKAELITGAYHFFNPKSDPEQQARLFIRNYTVEEGDLPPILDVEHSNPHITKAEFQNRVLRWLHLVEKEYGVKPIIYTGRNFKRDYLDAKEFEQYPLWLAHYYVEKMTYEGQWVLWQHTDCGEVKGIKGKVDCDIFNGTMVQFLALTIRDED